jgi:peptide/nickel transport system permease protein
MATVIQAEEAHQERDRSARERRGSGSGTAGYVLRKILGSLASLFFVSVLNFFMFRVLAGDPVKNLTRNRNVSVAAQALERKRLGLDQNVWHQFLTYLGGLPHGYLGISFKYGRPVTSVIGSAIWPTLLLVGTSTIVATIVGLWIGIRAGWNRGGRFDKISTGVTLTLYSMPEFWLGMLMILVFALGWGPIPGIFPTSGLIDPNLSYGSIHGILNVAWHLVLPVTTLTLVYLADYSLIMRATLLDETTEDYILTARAKGLRDAVIRQRHAVPNALLPTFTLLILSLGFVVGGAITVETVFSIPGLGLLSYTAIQGPDYPLLEGVFLLFTAAVIIANLIADLCYPLLDPRVRRT